LTISSGTSKVSMLQLKHPPVGNPILNHIIIPIHTLTRIPIPIHTSITPPTHIIVTIATIRIIATRGILITVIGGEYENRGLGDRSLVCP
jgi:hypothetical protein